MSEVAATSTTTATTTSSSTTTTASNSDFTQEDFITLLVEELTNQDPTEPYDTSEIVDQLYTYQSMAAIEEQTAAMTSVSEQMTEMYSLLNDMTLGNEFQSASGLISSYVGGTNSDGEDVTGTVSSVSLEDGVVNLKLSNGEVISYSDLTEIYS